MAQERIQIWFFIVFILAVITLSFFIFLPYLSVLFLALVFSIIFNPLYEWFLRHFGGKGTTASLLTVLAVLLVIVGPVSFFGTLLFQEVSDLYREIVGNSGNAGLSQSFNFLEAQLGRIMPGVNIQIGSDATEYLRQGLSWILDNLSIFFGGFLRIAFGLFLMLLALFYFLRDGKKFIEALIRLSPLSDDSDEKIMQKIVVAVNSVVRGHLVIGIIQGFLSGVGFAIFGMPSPILWGTVAAVASLAPTVGTSLVLVPAISFLFLTGHALSAIGLLVWGVLAVGLIDNMLGPILIERGVKIHPFLILLSALGGLSFFGPVGFLAGPVVLALLFALLDMYPAVVAEHPSH